MSISSIPSNIYNMFSRTPQEKPTHLIPESSFPTIQEKKAPKEFLAMTNKGVYAQASLEGCHTAEEMLKKANLNWDILQSPAKYTTETGQTLTVPSSKILYRSDEPDTVLGVVGHKFKVVQPKAILDFYDKVCKEEGYEISSLGYTGNGKRIWAQATKGESFDIKGDKVIQDLFFCTANDGSMSTIVRPLAKRMMCNNMLSFATRGRDGAISINHKGEVDFEQVRRSLSGIEEEWEQYQEVAKRLSSKYVSDAEAAEYFSKLYTNKRDKDENAMKKIKRMIDIYNNHPTQQTEATKDTAYGLLNAVTFYEDHAVRAVNNENRFVSAIMGEGSSKKVKAFELAKLMVA